MSVMRVTAYKQLIPLEHAAITPDGYVVNEMGDVVHNAICPMLNDPQGIRTKGLGEGQIYTFTNTLTFALYTQEQHNNFLEVLCELLGYPYAHKHDAGTLIHHGHLVAAREIGIGSMFELISLKRIGTIGPHACMKLANEMHAMRSRAQAFDKNMGFENGFYDQFMNWYDIFCTAGDDGLVTIY